MKPQKGQYPQDPALKGCVAVLPAFNPGWPLVALVSELLASGLPEVIVVDDGSDPGCASIFTAVEQLGAVLLVHEVNRGKGCALKTAMHHGLALGCKVLVTVDADGQHLCKDVLKVVLAAADGGNSPVLGVRQFAGGVPLRSRFGNILTQRLFGMVSGLAVSDTQTGLRALPSAILPGLLKLPGDRYEYEMNMLIHFARERLSVREVPIQTVYLDGNSSSHFRPLIDSARIYFVLFRDVFLSLSSFGIDIALFNVCYQASGSVVSSTYVARIISGLYNFAGNKYLVFKRPNADGLLREFLAYAALAAALATVSGVAVDRLLQSTGLNPTVCKVFVDLSLYALSFAIRRIFIFR